VTSGLVLAVFASAVILLMGVRSAEAQRFAASPERGRLDVSNLERCKASHRISVVRSDAILVEIADAGERWEVEFFESGEVEVERFRSDGFIAMSSRLWSCGRF
jgi:hypothetical protein